MVAQLSARSDHDDYVSFSKEQNIPEQFILTDIMGRIVEQAELSGLSGKVGIDVNQIPPGIYLYRIIASGAVKTAGKISKQ